MVAVLALGASCDSGGDAEMPPPAELTRDAVGNYCGMIVMDHKGPKAQIHLRTGDRVVWFTSVRDAIVFTRLPEEPDDITAFYVNDMARAESWDHPAPDTWMQAKEAVYVIGSSRRGGMGAKEAVPFSERAAASAFADRYGGQVLPLEEIPNDYVLGEGEPLFFGGSGQAGESPAEAPDSHVPGHGSTH